MLALFSVLDLCEFCVSFVGPLGYCICGYFMRGVALPPTKAAFLHQFMTKCPATPLQKEHKYFKYTFHIFPTLS